VLAFSFMTIKNAWWPPDNPHICPPPPLGFSLALCGAANVIYELLGNASWFPEVIREAIENAYTWLAFVLAFSYFLRALMYWKVLQRDLSMPKIIPNYAAGQMALLFLALRLLGQSNASDISVYALSAVQLILLALFLQRCWATSTLPEPFWNPPTVNCAVTTIVAASLGMPNWLVYWSFRLALFLQISIVPVECYRVIFGESAERMLTSNHDRQKVVANNISIALLQAPCSLNVVAWGALRRRGLHALPICGGSDAGTCEDAIGHFLFACAMLVLVLTGRSLWLRRKSIYDAGFSPAWAATTFPTCSSAIAALQYTGFSDGDFASPALLRDRQNVPVNILRLLAAMFATATSVLVFTMVLLFLRHQARTVYFVFRHSDSQGASVEYCNSSGMSARIQIELRSFDSEAKRKLPASVNELEAERLNPISLSTQAHAESDQI
jgi:tellurite resistance protein TehA-like permease